MGDFHPTAEAMGPGWGIFIPLLRWWGPWWGILIPLLQLVHRGYQWGIVVLMRGGGGGGGGGHLDCSVGVDRG